MFSRFCLLSIAMLSLVVSGCTSTEPAAVKHFPAPFHLELPRYGHGLATDGKYLYIFGGANKSGSLGDIEIINPHTKNTQVLKRHVIPRRFFSAVYTGNGSVYLIGGISKNETQFQYESRVEVFNTQTREVTLAAPLPFPTRINTAVHLDGKIYVIGGSHHDWETRKIKRTSLMAVYDISANHWSLAPPMLSEKATAAVVHKGKIYVVGGFDGETALDTFERFDPATNQWQTLTPLPQAVSAHSAVVWQDKLLTFGDFDDLNLTLVYDFKKEEWLQTSLDYAPSRHNKAAVIDDTLFVIGGHKGTADPIPLNTIQVFNPKSIKRAL